MPLPGRRVAVRDLEYHVVDEGTGTPVLLLHGFPDSSYLWRHQVPVLVDAGHRALAPDLRGFGQTDRPEPVEAYALSEVLADVLALLDALDVPRTHVVCHDWGAALGWLLAATAPERVDRLVALSVGHPAAHASQVSMEQREKSWYMLLFQFEGVAEALLQRDDWALFREFTRGHPELATWIPDLARPGALTAALNWYRANAHPRGGLARGPAPPTVAAPALGIWSSGDHYLTEAPMLRTRDFVTGPWRYERIEGASHWLQLDVPERLNALLVEFLRE